MRFYTISHKYYCGIDLHTKMMYVCILDSDANILIHKNIPTNGKAFMKLIEPYKEDIIVGVKCANESAGKKMGTSGSKIGNAYLKWALSEAAVLFIRGNDQAKKYLDKQAKKFGKTFASCLRPLPTAYSGERDHRFWSS